MIYNPVILNDIKDHLTANNQTLSVAESVTSGYLQAAFSSCTEAAKFFQGGITTYNLGQKTRHLNIDPIPAEKCQCVSEDVAIKMALNCEKLFLSNYALGITGYASPMPDMKTDKLYAFYAISKDQQVKRSGMLTTTKKDSIEAQIDYANQLIEVFFQLLH